jgi:hypothetical protein
LLLLDDRLQRIVAASENTEEFLEVPLTLILGALVEVVLEREVLGALKVQANSNEVLGSQSYLGVFRSDSSAPRKLSSSVKNVFCSLPTLYLTQCGPQTMKVSSPM